MHHIGNDIIISANCTYITEDMTADKMLSFNGNSQSMRKIIKGQHHHFLSNDTDKTRECRQI